MARAYRCISGDSHLDVGPDRWRDRVPEKYRYTPEPVAIHRSLRNARPRTNSSGQNGTTWSCFNREWE